MSQFKSERFRVKLQNPDTLESDVVTVQLGLNGLKIYSADGSLLLRAYELNNIARWVVKDSTLHLYTKSGADVEERQVSLQGDRDTIRNLLDTLTCACMQLYELLKNGEVQGSGETVNQLSSLAQREKNQKFSSSAGLLAEDIQFWRDPEKEGWLFSQGEVIKTWRRRWFVLKSGFLFRFADSDIDPSSKIRGIVDLTQVTDVSDGRKLTGKKNSIKLSTATGHVCYLADSETEMVEWISVLEQAVSKIVKKAAGIEEEEETGILRKKSISRTGSGKREEGSRSGRYGGLKSSSSWSQELLGSRQKNGNTMVDVIGYESYAATAPPASSEDTRINISDISGVSGAVMGNEGERYADHNPIVQVSYGDYQPLVSNFQRRGNGSNYPALAVPEYSNLQPTSIIDQQPQQQPAYPTYQTLRPNTNYNINMVNVAQPVQSASWQVLYTNDGRAYYHNKVTGHTQWERPPELAT